MHRNNEDILTDTELAAIRERRDAARHMVWRLCQPKGSRDAKEWIMSIPAQPADDPDLVIAAALTDARRLLDAYVKLKQAQEAHNDPT